MAEEVDRSAAKRLRDIEARHAASTPGEWVEVWSGSFCEVVTEDNFVIVVDDCLQPNAEFIAHAHQDVPWLVGRIKELERDLKHAEDLDVHIIGGIPPDESLLIPHDAWHAAFEDDE